MCKNAQPHELGLIVSLKNAIAYCSRERNCNELGLEIHLAQNSCLECASDSLARLNDHDLIKYQGGVFAFTEKAKLMIQRAMERFPDLFLEQERVLISMDLLFVDIIPDPNIRVDDIEELFRLAAAD